MSFLTNAFFWLSATERAVKTAAQSALLVLGAEQVDVLVVDWVEVVGFAVGGAVLSLLTSIASGGVGPLTDDPSLV